MSTKKTEMVTTVSNQEKDDITPASSTTLAINVSASLWSWVREPKVTWSFIVWFYYADAMHDAYYIKEWQGERADNSNHYRIFCGVVYLSWGKPLNKKQLQFLRAS